MYCSFGLDHRFSVFVFFCVFFLPTIGFLFSCFSFFFLTNHLFPVLVFFFFLHQPSVFCSGVFLFFFSSTHHRFSVFRIFLLVPQDNQAGRFVAGVSIEQAVSVSPEEMDEGPSYSPLPSEEISGKGSSGGVRRSSRTWTGR